MTIEQWLEAARVDAERRQLPRLVPLLDPLAQAMRVLRDADWNDDAGPHPAQPSPEPGGPPAALPPRAGGPATAPGHRGAR